MRELSADLRALFSDADVAAIAARPYQLTDRQEVDALDLAMGWAHRVAKLDQDRSLPWSDRTVWNEHDLAGSLFARDFLQETMGYLPAFLRERLGQWVAEVDERFRSYTVDDPAGRMGKVADVELRGRAWWWSRVPDSGPIVEDLARYS